MREYYDGLDADGYPVNDGAWRKPYVRGDESDVGEFNPVSIGQGLLTMVERAGRFREIGANCDSPIEEEIGAAVLMKFEHAGQPLRLCLVQDLKEPVDGLLLVPQFAWGYYRSDWAILNPSAPVPF
jgi:hypothetical protein